MDGDRYDELIVSIAVIEGCCSLVDEKQIYCLFKEMSKIL